MPAAQSEHGSPRKKGRKSFWYQFATQGFAGRSTVYSLHFAIYTFSSLAVLLLVGGAVLLAQALKQVEVTIRYDNVGPLAGLTQMEQQQLLWSNGSVSQTVALEVEDDMEAPVHVYYVLKDYYQNHKRYVRSVNYAQLHGDSVKAGGLTDCIPQRYIGGQQNSSLEENGVINPCGLIAWSYFNDTFASFELDRPDGSQGDLIVDSSELVWDSDRDTFFGSYEAVNHNTIPKYRGGQELTLKVSEDEHFMAWMKLAAHPDVRKYWGKIDQDLKKGDTITVTIDNAYNTYDFGGEKWIMLTTQNSFGNRNMTFGIAWIIMGTCCVAILGAYIFFGRQRLTHTRTVEDKRAFLTSKLSWKPKTVFT